MELINLAGLLLLALLIRKLVWCLRWLWCYYHGRETPAPISFLPSGRERPLTPTSAGRGRRTRRMCDALPEEKRGPLGL